MKKRNKLSILTIISTVIITTLAMKSYAHFTSKDVVTNVVNIGDVDIEVSEEFTPPTNWDGSDCAKIVRIQNNSKSPSLIRVAITPRWVDENKKEWPGDTNIVKLNYDSNNIISSPSITPEGKWVEEMDGYYYYNAILKAGNHTVNILNSVSVNIPPELKERYKDKTLIVDVKAEAIQATKEAHRSTWTNIKENSEMQIMLDSLCAR